VPTATLERYTGYFRLSTGLLFEVELSGGKLSAGPPGRRKEELKALSDTRFYVPPPINGELEFTQAPDGVLRVRLLQGSAEIPGTRVALQKFDAADLPRYAGTYWSEELETQYTLALKEGKLVAEHPRHVEIAMNPLAKDLLRGESWFFQEIQFTRDAAGNVDGLRVGGGRVRGIRFSRK